MATTILGVKAPKNACTDGNCPFHGSVNVKKETFKGTVIKRDSTHTATIEWFRPRLVPKYERYEIRRSRMRVHNPACVDAQIGDSVFVAKTRPLSKTKNAVVLFVVADEESAPVKKSRLPTSEDTKK
jgi:small subunit ribosomal protein S17